MIGKFYPFMVATASNVGAAFTVVNVRSTSAATELINSFEWFLAND